MVPPPESYPVYVLASALSFALMAWDKLRAVRGRRRVPERVLHLVELAGGWPGAFVAMFAVNHKRAKPSFWVLSVAIALLHVGLWVALARGRD